MSMVRALFRSLVLLTTLAVVSRLAGPVVVHGQQQPATPAVAAPSDSEPLPDVKTVLEAVRSRLQTDRELQSQYTYTEKRRDVKVSRLGKVEVGPLRSFEVYPSPKPGRTYKRLVAVDDKPLPPDELARRDEAHRQNVLAIIEREKTETPDMKAKRQKKDADDLREQRELIDDAFNVFEVKLTGRELLEGRRVIAGTLTPRPDAKTRSDEGKWMKKFKGRAWVAEDDYQVVKIEMEAIDDITLGLGIVGRVHEGSKFTFTRTKVNNEVWLPAEARFEASGRTLLFRKFRIFTVTSFSDYKKFNVETSTSYDTPKDP